MKDDPSADAGNLGFVHRYYPPPAESNRAAGVTLVLLHGTGGDENDLIPLGRALSPDAGLLSLRGRVLERGMPRFFRRIADGVFDQDDLARRTDELAEFIEAAAVAYGIERAGIVAVGFSNGANIAASMLLRQPGSVRSAVLFSPMIPFEPEDLPDLNGTRLFIGAGLADPIAPFAQAERLAEVLRRCGAHVTLHAEDGGHSVTEGEVDAARRWMIEGVAGVD